MQGVFTGIIKDNKDKMGMGRVRVYIPEFGGDPTDENTWFLVNYNSPQGGQTNPYSNTKGGKTEADSQDSYGSFLTGFHEENEVLIAFLGDDKSQGMIIGSMFQQNMTESMGGYAMAKTTDGKFLPTVEYNKRDEDINPRSPERPVFNKLYQQLLEQGILNDKLRTNATTSPMRDTVPQFMSIKTPSGSTMVIDDGKIDPNAGAGVNARYYARDTAGGTSMIRLRSDGGSQIVINDDCGFIHMMSSTGNSWAQLSDEGVVYFTEGSIAIRVEGNFNDRIDGNYNSETLGTTTYMIAGDSNITTDGSYNLNDFGSGISLESKAKYGAKSMYDSIHETESILSYKAANNIVKKAATILKNTTAGPPPIVITEMTTEQTKDVARVDTPDPMNPVVFENQTQDSTLPSGGLATHEPFAGNSQSCGKPGDPAEDTGAPDEETQEQIDQAIENGEFKDKVLGVDADRLNEINDYLISEGYTKEQRAAILGTFMQESGIRPGVTNGIGAHGLAQWLGSRRHDLNAFAAGKGLNPNSLNTQLQFFSHEMNGTERKAGNMLRNSRSVNEAMGAMNRYERFLGWQNGQYGAETGKRYDYANIFNQYLR